MNGRIFLGGWTLPGSALMAAALIIGPVGQVVADDLDVTMEVVGEHASEERIARELRLPEAADQTAEETSREGLETASEARDRGRDFGQDRAESARQRGDEARQRGEEGRQRGEEARQRGDEARQERGAAQERRDAARERGQGLGRDERPAEPGAERGQGRNPRD